MSVANSAESLNNCKINLQPKSPIIGYEGQQSVIHQKNVLLQSFETFIISDESMRVQKNVLEFYYLV